MRRVVFLSFIFVLVVISPVLAVPNNKFGIHITFGNDLDLAAWLVNSNGGDWGYVTVVIPENQKDQTAWQDFFDRCREKHLIPIVRLATHLEGSIWAKPSLDSLPSWTDFLDSLNWPVKDRWIVVFNEPNHAKEWGGQVNPGEYAQVLNQAINVFKLKNPDFLLVNAGLDQAAPDSSETMDELDFLKKMNAVVPGIFSRLDGWASHAYPNHGFIGRPWETGRATIKGYEWELGILENHFGVSQDLPVLITETGWPVKNQKPKIKNQKFYDEERVAEYTKQAFENIWLKDKKVMAVTPFLLHYLGEPFENFSWLDENNQPLLQYEKVKGLLKVKGEPEQEESYQLISCVLPPYLPANFVFEGKIKLKNTGQSIWGEKPFVIKTQSGRLKLSDLQLPEEKLVKPGEIAEFDFVLETSEEVGDYTVSWENLPEFQLKVFEVWALTNRPHSLFHRLYQKFLSLCYRKGGFSGPLPRLKFN